MGFKRPTKTFVLDFDGNDEFEGLEIEVKSLPVGEFLRLSKLFEDEERNDAHVEEMFRIFHRALKSWNVTEDDDTPIDPTYENLLTFDADFLMSCINAWIQALSGVNTDLGKDSTSGETSPAPSIPMAPVGS